MNKAEAAVNVEVQKRSEGLDKVLNERNEQLARFKYELENSRMKQNSLLEDNKYISNDMNNLKDHIRLLTEQNQKVTILI